MGEQQETEEVGARRGAAPRPPFSVRPVQLLAALFTADIASMALMNAAVLPTRWLPLVFTAALGAALVLVSQAKLAPTAANAGEALSPTSLLWARLLRAVLCLAVILPRVSYLVEPLRGYVIDPMCWDDHWHIQELSSLVNSPRFPPASTFVPASYLSFYYAPWMVIATVYLALPIPWLTIKLAFFLGHTLYALLVIHAAFHLAWAWTRAARPFWFLIYAALLYAGAESGLALVRPAQHNEWWMRDFFGLQVQISAFSTLAILVIHHLSSAAALLLAFSCYEAARRDDSRRIADALLLGALLAYSLYASVFVVIGAAPVVAYVVTADWLAAPRRGRLVLMAAPVAVALASPMLWMYLVRRPGVHFRFGLNLWPFSRTLLGHEIVALDWFATFGLFAVLMSLEMCLLVYVYSRSLDRVRARPRDAMVALLCWGYILSLFFIRFTGANNYALRGTIIPVVLLCFVAARHLPAARPCPALLYPLLAVLSLGSLNEVANMGSRALVNSLPLERAARLMPSNHDLATLPARRRIYDLNRDRGRTRLTPADLGPEADRIASGSLFYLVEKPVEWLPREPDEIDRELIAPGPFGPWSYQAWQGQH